jgi:hypothetical protein
MMASLAMSLMKNGFLGPSSASYRSSVSTDLKSPESTSFEVELPSSKLLDEYK